MQYEVWLGEGLEVRLGGWRERGGLTRQKLLKMSRGVQGEREM